MEGVTNQETWLLHNANGVKPYELELVLIHEIEKFARSTFGGNDAPTNYSSTPCRRGESINFSMIRVSHY